MKNKIANKGEVCFSQNCQCFWVNSYIRNCEDSGYLEELNNQSIPTYGLENFDYFQEVIDQAKTNPDGIVKKNTIIITSG